jgi:anti-anti-sigma factor
MAGGDHTHDPNRVSLIGDISMANAASHGDLLCNLLDLAGEPTLVIDCTQVEYLEPQGLAMMQWVHRHGVARGTEVWWVGLAPRHLQLLEKSGLGRTLRCRPAGDAGGNGGFTPR